MTKEQAEMVNKAIANFDFEKVHSYMKLVEWKWFDRVPTLEDLKGTATRLLVEAAMDPQHVTSLGTGGFRVYKLPWGLEIVFALNRSGTF